MLYDVGMESTAFDIKGFGQAVASIRQSRRLSLSKVASESGIARSTLHRIEQGENVGIDQLTQAAAWAKLSLDHYAGLR